MNILHYNASNYLQYINSCDLINRYSLDSVQTLPEIESIQLELPVSEQYSLVKSGDNDYEKYVLKNFLLFYFLNLRLPYVRCNQFKKLPKNFTLNLHYSLLLSFKNKTDINNLLLMLYHEKDLIGNNLNLTKTLNHLSTNSLNCKIDNFSLPVLAEYRKLFNLIFSRSELQHLKFTLNIVFKCCPKKLQKFEELKNIFPFWNL